MARKRKVFTGKARKSKPTAAQQRARREYVKMTGHVVTPEHLAKLRAEWEKE